MKAELKDNQKLIVNIGADVTVEKTIPEVLRLLKEQKEKITENLIEAESVLKELHEHGRRMYLETSEEAE